jgi:cyclophilin family peptidyl-prolyl cis-trans isomerase
MKKIFFSLILMVFLTGCNQSSLNTEADAGKINENKLNLEVGQSSRETANKNNENNKMQENKSVTYEDLTKEYSVAVLKTNMGEIKLKFYAEASPVTVNNFLNLAKDGFYDGTRFHRVIKDFMIQGGDPKSKDLSQKNMWGTGDPGYKFSEEINSEKLVRGSLAMANSGPNTNGSQFFIVTAPATPWLDGKHTNFGYVAEGMEIVEQIESVDTDANDRPAEDIIIESIELVN